MDALPDQEELLFDEARKLKRPTERRNFLDRACADAPKLRRRVEELLAANEHAEQFFAEGSAAIVQSSLDLPVTEAPGDRIGKYKLLQKIGEGGCGLVYMAEQEEPVRRRVALKIIKLGMDTRRVVARFEAERRALAMMEHPNIATVFDAGTTNTGRPYFVMELVRGPIITRYCDAAQLSVEERLKLFLQVCYAVQHAHQKGIIHRDIKPSNVLVTVNDGIAVPKVIDFGIAKAIEGRLTDQTLFTAFEQFLGTPAYMSPEQAVMTSLDVDTRSDIYSLGVLLYELLTGKTPFDTKTLLEAGLDAMRRTIMEEQPPLPSTQLRLALQGEMSAARARSPLSADLDWISMKCLEKDRARRYQTAGDLAVDIQNHLSNRPVIARPPSAAYRLQKLVLRNRLAFTAGFAFALLILLSTAIVVYESQNGRRVATESLVRQHVSNGARLMKEGDLLGSLLAFTEALRLEAGNPAREEAHRIRIGSVLQRCPKLVGVFSHAELLNGAVFSSDNQRLLTGSDDGAAKVWDLASGRMLLDLTQKDGPIYRVQFSPDNRLILTMSRALRLWDAQTGEQIVRTNIHALFRGNIPQPRFSPDSTKLLTRVNDYVAQVWRIADDSAVGKPLRSDQLITHFEFSPDGRLVYTLSDERVVRVWNAETGDLVWTLRHNDRAFQAAFSPDSREIAVTGDSNEIALWDLSSGTLQTSPRLAHRNELSSLLYDPRGERILTKSVDRSVQVWDRATGEQILALMPSGLPVYHIGFSPDGQRIVVGANRLTMWDANSGELIPPVLRHTYWREPAAFSRDGRMLATIRGNQVQVWDLAVPEPAKLPIRPVSFFTSKAMSADGVLKARIGGDNVVRVANASTEEPAGPAMQHGTILKQVIFGAEPDLLVAETGDARVEAWDVKAGQPLTPLFGSRYDLAAPPLRKADLPISRMPVDDLVLLGKLLSGNKIGESGSFEALDLAEIQNSFDLLRPRHPDLFRRTSAEALAWHEEQASACEQGWNWAPAIFHLEQLIAHRPHDKSNAERIEYAKRALDHARSSAAGFSDRLRVTPPRNPHAPAGSVDLSPYYNLPLRSLTETFPSGLQTLSGTTFDVRGIVQLRGSTSSPNPRAVSIPVNRSGRELKVLFGTRESQAIGSTIGSFTVYAKDGRSTKFPIIYGEDVRKVSTESSEDPGVRHGELVWLGNSRESARTSRSLRAFIRDWKNPLPESQITTIDFESASSGSAPFLIALTIE